ncbi:MAG: HAD family hydrolase [Nitrospinota bacterium]|nr:MAG: HAD family hydrolase [Nitrospinota bacterium]
MLNDVEAFLFDFDGTLAVLNIDFRLMRKRVETVLRRYGIDPEPFRHLYILEMIDQACALLTAGHRAELATECYREAHQTIIDMEVECAQASRLLPGVAEMLGELKARGFRLGIVTRNCAAAVRTIFPQIEQACHAFLPRDFVQEVKPAPAHLRQALCKMEAVPERSAMVGDGPIDIDAGKRLRMKTIGVLTGNHNREALIRSQPDLILDRVTDLLTYLKEEA